MGKYVIGIDFGTLSARAVIVDAATGNEVAEAAFTYPHGVMEAALPSGTPLPSKMALEHPRDYLIALKTCIRDALAAAELSPDDIKGVGVDFTGCTLLPVDEDGKPLCFKKEFEGEPCAYVQLWKSHCAESQAIRITEVARERGEKWLDSYGGTVSSEWMLPKILYTLENAPRVYESAYRFTEAGDWITFLMTGNETHATSFAGLKMMWSAREGYPSDDFFLAVDSRLGGIVGTKISTNVRPVGEKAGYITESGAELTGLNVGTPVAQAVIDAPAGMPALGIVEEGELMAILGTSANYVINSREEKPIKGIAGYVKDSIYSGYYTYEAGQCCFGDGFDWFVKNFVPAEYEADAKRLGVGIHEYLRRKAADIPAGGTGLVVLDWFNGNRSILSDGKLSGMILGLNTSTRAEHIYKAMIEGMTFGAKMIIDNYVDNGIPVKSIYASGGIALKDPMLMQTMSDVLGMEIKVCGSKQACALGSAVYGALAAGIYDKMSDAIRVMSKPPIRTYYPDAKSREKYLSLFEEYKRLHDYFGRGENEVMKRISIK